MNTSRLILAAAVLALSGAAAHSAGTHNEKNEARLTKMLEGRAPGEPVSCLPAYKSDRLEVIEGVALVYDAGDIVYVAKPTQPNTLGRNDIVVIERFGGTLCHTDVVRTVDRSGGYFTGVLFLDKFVPYRKQN